MTSIEDPEESTLLAMELRQQTLEKEMAVLKDTVWRLTGRVFVLESFLSEKFDELVVDFGLKLSLTAGGHANFLAQAMSAEASVVSSSKSNNNNHHHDIVHLGDGDGSEEMSIGGGDNDDDDRPPPSVGANITVTEGQQQHLHNGHGGDSKGHGSNHVQHGGGHHNRVGNSTSVSLGMSSPMGLMAPRDVNDERTSHTDDNDNNYHNQSDFNVEEFVVFPHVPEFILGQEVQNGSSALMSVPSSEDSNADSDCGEIPHHRLHHHHNQHHSHDLGSSPPSTSSNLLTNPHYNRLGSGGSGGGSGMRRNPRYKCIPCAKMFTSEWHLKAHLVKHSQPPNLIMSGMNTANNSGSEQGSPSGQDSASNNNDPSNVKPFACAYCGKRFKKRQELTVHLRIHTGEKPYKCPVCDRGFSQSSSMKTHLRIHTGEKPFKCRFCKSSFTVMHNYKKHLQTTHQIDDVS
ncbi:Zinc finger protein 81 [Folsomia candida]|uniref:Protein krueppel n=1 Tax=Folsomia candida TaxID=158441 RepID=A0A226EHJ6_FOLCA|nr:Zinc finger protein 81 [Folsomia candida]